MRVVRNHARLMLAMAIFACILIPAVMVFAAGIPHAADRHRNDLTRQAHLVWGLNAPVATFAAQLHQESGWNPEAVSRVGAKGMAQFMPATAQWWCQLNSLSAEACQPTNPTWAMRALVGYDKWLWDRIRGDPCSRMAAALRSYNGGLGYVQREARTGQPCTAFRSAANCRENLAYPHRILTVLEPVYVRNAWGPGSCNG